MAKQRQVRMQYRQGSLGALQDLEHRTEEQLLSESKHRAAARAVLGARAAERYDSQAARRYFNEALAGCHPQERPALRQMMKASLAQAERRPDDLKAAMEKLGQTPPSGRQLFMLRIMGLVAPPASAGMVARVRGIVVLVLMIVVLVALGLGIVELISLPFGGISVAWGILLGLILVAAVLSVLNVLGRRRQKRAAAARGR